MWFGKISCNQSIVVGGVDKYFRCQHFFGFGCRISVVFQLIDYQSIVFGIGDDRNEFVVFSSGPDHSGPADIYIFNDFCMGYPFFQNGLFKRVKVTNHNIDRFYSQFCHLFPMLFVVTDRQNTTFYIGMQGLHSAVKTFGELSQI